MSIHVCIPGPSLCGKTNMAKCLSASRFVAHGRRTLALDLNGEFWGPHALVFTLPERIRNPPDGVFVSNEERKAAVDACRNAFLAKMWSTRDLDVFIDECMETVGRDADLTGVFTRGRHRGHTVFAMTHDATAFLPTQRAQFGTLFLFRQDERAAGMWAREWSEQRIMKATTLKKYQFLKCAKFAAPDGDHLIEPGQFPPFGG